MNRNEKKIHNEIRQQDDKVEDFRPATYNMSNHFIELIDKTSQSDASPGSAGGWCNCKFAPN